MKDATPVFCRLTPIAVADRGSKHWTFMNINPGMYVLNVYIGSIKQLCTLYIVKGSHTVLPSQLRNLTLYATPWVFAFSEFQVDPYLWKEYVWCYILSSWFFASCWPYSTSLSIQVWILYENCQFLSNRIPDCHTYIANCHMCDTFLQLNFLFSA